MARASYITTLLGGLEATQKRAFKQVFDYLCDNLRFGQPISEERAENFQAYFYEATTPAVANTEFTITHSLGRPPYLLIPVLSLEAGAQLVPLTVSQTPDSYRIYLTSSVTNAPVRVLVEG